MFWDLNGATPTPRRASIRHRPVTTVDLPASLAVPQTMRPPASFAPATGPSVRLPPTIQPWHAQRRSSW